MGMQQIVKVIGYNMTTMEHIVIVESHYKNTSFKSKDRIDVSKVSMRNYRHNKCYHLSNHCGILTYIDIKVENIEAKKL